MIASAVGGVAIATWVTPTAPSPQFATTIRSGATVPTFFLFLPITGIRLFIEDRTSEGDYR